MLCTYWVSSSVLLQLDVAMHILQLLGLTLNSSLEHCELLYCECFETSYSHVQNRTCIYDMVLIALMKDEALPIYMKQTT